VTDEGSSSPDRQQLLAIGAAYLAAATAHGFAVSTLASRRQQLALFFSWCEEKRIADLSAIHRRVLERYRAWLAGRQRSDGSSISLVTQSHQLSAVRMLMAWAARTKRIRRNPAAELELPRLPKRLPRAVFSISEVERVLAQADVSTVLGLRDRAVMEVLYSTGIRRMELVGLDFADFDVERGALFIREGKGRKDRIVPIGQRAIRWTSRYLEEARSHLMERPVRRGKEAERHALFLNARGRRIRATKLTERLHSYITAAGIGKQGSVHIFRHTMATLMHDGGADIRDLQELLGHAQLSTTEIYTHVSIERLKAVHARTHPAGRAEHAPELLIDWQGRGRECEEQGSQARN